MSPRIAIIDSNTLAAVGLRQLLQTVMPAMTVDTFTTFAEFQAAHPDRYFHYFTAMNIVLENRDFFTLHRHKTIVLTPLTTHEASLQAFHTLCTSQSEAPLVRSLLMLQQHAHGGGRNLPPMVQQPQNPLTRREVEVMTSWRSSPSSPSPPSPSTPSSTDTSTSTKYNVSPVSYREAPQKCPTA